MPLGAIVSAGALVSKSIQDIAGAIQTNRSCAVEITNRCQEPITDPEWHCYSGYVHDPLPVKVHPMTREAASFTKTSDTACGAVFVFTYKLDSRTRFAVMVSVPYDYGYYENWYGARFISSSTRADYDLYYDMYYNAPNNSTSKLHRSQEGKAITIQQDKYEVAVNMSDCARAILELHVCNV